MSITKYLKDSYEELSKIAWPTKKQVRNYTILVLVISALVGLYLNVFDTLFSNFVEYIIESF